MKFLSRSGIIVFSEKYFIRFGSCNETLTEIFKEIQNQIKNIHMKLLRNYSLKLLNGYQKTLEKKQKKYYVMVL